VKATPRHRHGPILRDGKTLYVRCLDCDLVAQVRTDGIGRYPEDSVIKSLAGKHTWIRRREAKGFTGGDGI
jgi:hypothetical protein